MTYVYNTQWYGYQDMEFDTNSLTTLQKLTVNRNPTSDEEVSNQNHIDNELNKNTFSRFSHSLQNYLKISVGNDVYNLTKNHRIQFTDTTVTKYPNHEGVFLQQRIRKCSDENNNGK